MGLFSRKKKKKAFPYPYPYNSEKYMAKYSEAFNRYTPTQAVYGNKKHYQNGHNNMNGDSKDRSGRRRVVSRAVYMPLQFDQVMHTQAQHARRMQAYWGEMARLYEAKVWVRRGRVRMVDPSMENRQTNMWNQGQINGYQNGQGQGLQEWQAPAGYEGTQNGRRPGDVIP